MSVTVSANSRLEREVRRRKRKPVTALHFEPSMSLRHDLMFNCWAQLQVEVTSTWIVRYVVSRANHRAAWYLALWAHFISCSFPSWVDTLHHELGRVILQILVCSFLDVSQILIFSIRSIFRQSLLNVHIFGGISSAQDCVCISLGPSSGDDTYLKCFMEEMQIYE